MVLLHFTKRFKKFGMNPYTRKPIRGMEDIYEKTIAALADYKVRSSQYKLKSRKESDY